MGESIWLAFGALGIQAVMAFAVVRIMWTEVKEHRKKIEEHDKKLAEHTTDLEWLKGGNNATVK